MERLNLDVSDLYAVNYTSHNVGCFQRQMAPFWIVFNAKYSFAEKAAGFLTGSGPHLWNPRKREISLVSTEANTLKPEVLNTGASASHEMAIDKNGEPKALGQICQGMLELENFLIQLLGVFRIKPLKVKKILLAGEQKAAEKRRAVHQGAEPQREGEGPNFWQAKPK